MKLCIITTASPLLRSTALLSLTDLAPTLLTDIDDEGVSMTLIEGLDTTYTTKVPLAHSCITCSLREGILPYLYELAASGFDHLFLALPVGAEAINSIPSLVDACQPEGDSYASNSDIATIETTCACHLVDTDVAARDLFEHISLADIDSALFEGDDRCTGELLMNGIGYADLVCALGDEGLGLDLVEHLRPLDTLMVRHLDELTTDLLFSGTHNPDEAIARIHPTCTQAWGGPEGHGVWTLDLHSDRPFHPERLANEASSLAPAGICARGCFWLPSRPTMIGTWEVSGGGVSVGTAGEWDDDAFTHLIITGTGDEAQRQSVRKAFQRMLMTEEEMADALAWVGADDGMSDWFEQ